MRAIQGHHQVHSVSKAVQKYGRDDLVGQIQCQRDVLAAIHGGWVPTVPLHRGVSSLPAQCVFEAGEIAGEREPLSSHPHRRAAVNQVSELVGSEPCSAFCRDEETEEESVDSEVSCSPASSSGSESEVECVTSGSVSSYAGPWLLNCVTGWFHKAISSGNACDEWKPACRPKTSGNGRFELLCTDPSFQGWIPCGHSAAALAAKGSLGPKCAGVTHLMAALIRSADLFLTRWVISLDSRVYGLLCVCSPWVASGVRLFGLRAFAGPGGSLSLDSQVCGRLSALVLSCGTRAWLRYAFAYDGAYYAAHLSALTLILLALSGACFASPLVCLRYGCSLGKGFAGVRCSRGRGKVCMPPRIPVGRQV